MEVVATTKFTANNFKLYIVHILASELQSMSLTPPKKVRLVQFFKKGSDF